MRKRERSRAAAATMGATGASVLLLGFAVAGAASAANANAGDADWTPPRTAYGHPDLQGVWANNNGTPLQRPAAWAGKERLTDEEFQELMAAVAEATDPGADALFGDQLVLAAIERTKATSYDPTTGNYNQFWIADRHFTKRTSLVVDPPDGLIPPFTEPARKRLCKRVKHLMDHPADSWLDRPIPERCISYGAPFIFPGYNGYHQIFQTPDHVVIHQEMIHDARVVRLNDESPLDDDVRLWNGDSRGHWDGDTLVVETTNYSRKNDFMGSSEQLAITERFTLTDPETLEWEVTVNDPGTWTRPWTASIPLKRTEDAIYEYACHEGNYGMEGMLAGARAEEAANKPKQPDPGVVFRYPGLSCDF